MLSKQNYLTEGPLLDAHGHLDQAGYHTALIRPYDRSAVTAPWWRIKEWDYYLVTTPHYAVALTIADNGYMGLDSISLLDFDLRWEHTASPMRLFPRGSTGLPATSVMGDVAVHGKRYQLDFRNDGTTRHLTAHMDNFCIGRSIDIDLTLTDPPQHSMVIATPFAGRPDHFYYNQKINCLRASGVCRFDDVEYVFDPAESTAVLDWGRGVWTYRNTWYWGSGSGWSEGRRIGWNLGYGFGDTSAASENMLFVDGIAHKLDRVTFHIPQKNGAEDYLSPWRIEDNEGRVRLTFTPVLDRASRTSVGIISSDQHQVFGHFDGEFILDTGERLPIRHFLAFAEKVMNKW